MREGQQKLARTKPTLPVVDSKKKNENNHNSEATVGQLGNSKDCLTQPLKGLKHGLCGNTSIR
jgi:hypothetical protein